MKDYDQETPIININGETEKDRSFLQRGRTTLKALEISEGNQPAAKSEES